MKYKIQLSSKIMNRINEKGGRLYLVGGAVRDFLINKEPRDYDFYVENISRREFKDLFPEAEEVGKSFQVFILDGHDFIISNEEDNKKNNNKLKKCMNIKKELKRRDFSINAMALDMQNNKLIDPFNGKKDLDNYILRDLTTSLEDDPLRIYRAVRLISELSKDDSKLIIAEGTKERMKKLKDFLENITIERVFEEFKKALGSNNPTFFFRELQELDLLNVHFSEIDNLVDVPQMPEYHPEGDVFTHTMLSLKASVKESDDLAVRFAVLVHDLGKALTEEDILPQHYGHDNNGIKPLRKLCKRLKIPKRWQKAGELAVKEHMRAWSWRKMRPGKIVRLMEKARRSPIGLEGLAAVIKSDKSGRGERKLDMSDLDLIISLGKDLFRETGGEDISGSKEGPEFGQALFEYRCRWIKENLPKY